MARSVRSGRHTDLSLAVLQRAVDPKAQFLAWVKYLFAFFLSWLGGKATGDKAAAAPNKKTERAMLLLGCGSANARMH